MSYLNREWALNFIFYFCDCIPSENALLITDHTPRLDVDFSLFGTDMYYCLPEGHKDELAGRDDNQITFFSSNTFPALNRKFHLIIIDLEHITYRHLLIGIIKNLEENGNLVVFDWSKRTTTTLFKLPSHLGLGNNRKSLIENQVYDLNGVSLKLNWYFFPVPGLEKPRKLVRRGFRSIIPDDTKSNVKRILGKMGLFYLQKHQRILIGKTNNSKPEASFLEELFERIRTEQPAPKNTMKKKSIRQFSISGTKILILDALVGNGEYIIRFPLDQTAADRIHQQVELVRFLNGKKIGLVPKVIEYNRDAPLKYYVEEKIQGGTTIRSLNKKNDNSVVPLYNEMLHNIVRIHTQFGKHVIIDDTVFNTHFSPTINTILENTKGDPDVRKVFNFIKTGLYEKLKNQIALRSICHGDLKIENGIFDSHNRLKGIFDWDMGERDGLTITDLACLLATSIRMQYYKSTSLANFMKNFKTVPDEFIPSYSHYFEATQTSFIDPRMIILYYWTNRLYRLLRYHYDSNVQWMKENINPVLERVGDFLE
jgi:thiamine kinase-like enzyme